ncbi:hypothetical protein J7T55_002664 [Diaporthe amygdali]|uniref:uncharacterized protein n=1 Tax=Phomopsis amygdali TaxID=1214568 RepID=UPI0022FF0C74|nr:uncharacterized protein J7T55_002664 [Diaporthe amygdali]KAJ0122152.1 hypothetical protein J7T55_002664 [Diaporthe amygdali]
MAEKAKVAQRCLDPADRSDCIVFLRSECPGMQVSALTEDLMQPTERIRSQMQPNHLGMPADSSAKTEPLIQVNDSLLWARETGFPIGSHPVSRQCILPL